MNQKFILIKNMHLGHCKDTFARGSVIELIEDKNILIINGRRFTDTRDIDILIRHEFVVPYSEEALAEISGNIPAALPTPPKPRPGEGMEVVQSDADAHPTIDIRDTKISARNEEKKQMARTAAKTREVDRKMEIIKGDESVEERIARLKDKTDPSSVSERVALKRQRATMPIVRDDSLGMGTGGKNAIAMNAGQHLPSPAEAAAKQGEVSAKAEAYKAQVNRTRKASGVEVPDDAEPSPLAGQTEQDIPPELNDVQTPGEAARDLAVPVEGTVVSEDVMKAVDAENTALKTENAELKTTLSAILERLAALEESSKPKPPGRPKGVKDATKRKTRAVKKVGKKTAAKKG